MFKKNSFRFLIFLIYLSSRKFLIQLYIQIIVCLNPISSILNDSKHNVVNDFIQSYCHELKD